MKKFIIIFLFAMTPQLSQASSFSFNLSIGGGHHFPAHVDFGLLSHYGENVVVAGIGYWRPHHDPHSWAPFVNGHFHHDHAGRRVWVSYDPWGEYTDHHGTWRDHHEYGWIWRPFPERRWVPHTVTFFTGIGLSWYPFYAHAHRHHWYKHGHRHGFRDGYDRPRRQHSRQRHAYRRHLEDRSARKSHHRHDRKWQQKSRENGRSTFKAPRRQRKSAKKYKSLSKPRQAKIANHKRKRAFKNQKQAFLKAQHRAKRSKKRSSNRASKRRSRQY